MKKILIVDDNPKNIQVLANTLIQEDYEIEFAENGQQAIDIITEEPFDIILMDVMMPVMNGFDACRKIKSTKERNNIPIIFLTAKTNEESITEGFEAGGIDYITKPFNSKELLSRVKTHLELKENREKLEKMNTILEQKVANKTKDLKDANAKLKEVNKELETLDTAKNDFLQLISHEIRTPLNGIIGMSDIIQEEANGNIDIELFDILNKSCKRLESFSLHALDISALNLNSKKQLQLNNSEIKDVIENVVTKNNESIKLKNISVDTNIEKCKLDIDTNYISKCVNILLKNAIYHTPENGKIEINSKTQNSIYIVKIKDSGNGFPEELLNNDLKLFNNPNHMDSNPGIGLYLCKIIAKSHCGELILSNNNGAVIELILPLK